MFKAKTVFVLGAGSSCEVGLPAGSELRHVIADLLDIRMRHGVRQESGDEQIALILRAEARNADPFMGNMGPILTKAWALRDALPLATSIDNLLDAHREPITELCGKLGIVKAILDAERKSHLFFDQSRESSFDRRKVSETWFGGFFRALVEGVPVQEIDSLFENVAIVNFNYDRCVEHYLFHALQTYYSINEDRVKEVLKHFNIYHPYGRVGELPFQLANVNAVQFGDAHANLRAVASSIKTFTEVIEENEMLANIKHAIASAKQLVFLGFAFHEQNLKLLNPTGNSTFQRIIATAFGISDADRQVIQRDLVNGLKPNATHTVELLPAAKSADVFNEYRRTLTASI